MGGRSGRGSGWGSIDPCAAWFGRRAIGGVQKATTGECRGPPKKEKKKKIKKSERREGEMYR